MKRILLFLLLLTTNASAMPIEDYVASLERIDTLLAANQRDAAKNEALTLKDAEVEWAKGRFKADPSLLAEIANGERARLIATIAELRRTTGMSATQADRKLLEQIAAEQEPSELPKGGIVPTKLDRDIPLLERIANSISDMFEWIRDKIRDFLDWLFDLLPRRRNAAGQPTAGLHWIVWAVVAAILLIILYLAFDVLRRSRAKGPAEVETSAPIGSKQTKTDRSRGATEWERCRRARECGPIPRSDSRVVPRRPRHLLRHRHPPLPQGPHELGVHRSSRRHSNGVRTRSSSRAIRAAVVRRAAKHTRRVRRVQRAGAHRPRRTARCRVRRLLPLLLAIAAFVAIGVVWIISDERASERVYDELSSANTSDAGLSQAYAYLARRGKAAMLTRPVGRDPIEANAVVFRFAHELPIYFDPEDLDEKEFGPPKPKEKPLLSDAEDAFVRRGGRVIIGAHMGLLTTGSPSEKTAVKVFPVWPGVDQLKVPELTSAFLELRPRMHAVLPPAIA
jgi:hypothetical protein